MASITTALWFAHLRTPDRVSVNSPAARQRWADVYQQLAEPQAGIAGAISTRAEAHAPSFQSVPTVQITPSLLHPAATDWRGVLSTPHGSRAPRGAPRR
jgi:hypothetical protein